MEQLIWRVEHLAEIDSTNHWLARRGREGADEGLVVYADFQSAGRGRLERVWQAPARSSLLCSILLRPTLDVDSLQLVVAAVALATRAALVRLSGLRPQLKWPNDLVVDDIKLAGMLSEVLSDAEGLAVVVGLGLNLTDHPDGVAATDVRAVTGVTISARGLLDILFEELEPRYARLESVEGRDELRAEYRGSLATIGQRVRVERSEDAVVGEVTDVDECGRLVVNADGTTLVFSTGDVVHVRPQLRAST